MGRSSRGRAIRVLTDAPGEITLRVQTETPRWLVVDEGYDPGWQAAVDGVSQAIHPANELFQAVLMPAGMHTLHLTYRPVDFALGARLSLLAGLVLALLLLREWVRRRSQPRRGRSGEDAPEPGALNKPLQSVRGARSRGNRSS